MMPSVPWTALDSKVSMDCGRYSVHGVSNLSFQSYCSPSPTYVKRLETSAVLIEGLVVELDELSCA